MPSIISIAVRQSEALRLKRLFYARFVASIILMLVFNWLESTEGQSHHKLLPQIFGLWIVLSVIQFGLFKWPQLLVINLSFQLLSDLFLIGFLIFGSGGITSPFVFLLGVVIITAGTQARVLLVLGCAVLACITYLSVIYIHAIILQQPLFYGYTLHILLQTSVFLLVGGIMALIARRHADLQREKRQVTTKHRRLQELHSQVLGAMQEGVVVLNEHLIIQDFNPAAANILDATQQHIGSGLSTVLRTPKGMRDFVQHPDKLLFRSECQHQGQPLLLTLTRLIEEKSAWLLTIVNLAEVRQLERQLAEQDKLASIGQMAAMLAHEIRNPMQTIGQAVELMSLGQTELDLERIIADEIARLNRLVSDMLDYAHPLYPHPQATDLKLHINESIQQVDLTNTYQVQTQVTSLPVFLDADHFRLLLDNLLRNAIIASPLPASICIACEIQGGQWILSIRDHGKGIAPDMRDKLFEPFRTGRKTGTGLGLATVSQVCDVNGWLIEVDDSVEDGACFRVTGNMDSRVIGGDKHG